MRVFGARLLPLIVTMLLMPLSQNPAHADSSTWSLDDLIRAENANDWSLSPDGHLAVWVKSTVEKVDGKEQRVDNLWLSDTAEGRSFALTRGQQRLSDPAFSPDGRHIAFLADRPLPAKKQESKLGKRQLWVIPVGGGEAYPVTRFDRSVSTFGWRDAKRLIVAAQESPSAWEKERKEAKDTSVVVDDADREPPVRLFRVELEGKAERLSHNRDWIRSLTVSPDGRWAVVSADQSLHYDFDQKVPPHTSLVDLETGTFERLFADGARLPFSVRWQRDSGGFYFTDEYTRHPVYRMATIVHLYHFQLEGRRSTQVDLAWPRGLGRDYAVTEDGVLALLADGVRFRPARYLRQGDGWQRQDLEGAHVRNIDTLVSAADAATVVYRSSAANRPPQGFSARLDGNRLTDERQITKLNPSFDDKPTGKVEVIRWAGAGGDEVEGLLHFPLDWKEGEGPRPLVLDIHGGPAGTDLDSWDQRYSGPTILYRQRGAFILQVNYHGSAGYGLDWVESIAGRYYEQERVDIETGVDHLIEKGLVDPDRLGVGGWSNGGILTADLITQTTRYRAASVGAADVEWVSDWGNVDFGAAFDNYYFGGTPWEKTDHYNEKSPFFRLDRVTTPTIIFTGTEDRNVPPHQSWSLFRALQYLEKAPARLVLFPGEPHGLRKIAHQRRKAEEELAWFDRYLFGKDSEKSAAIPDDSLLAGRLGALSAARSGNRYGATEQDRLIPETVARAGMKVGRFEVTRAQLAAFDPSFDVGDNGNLPATGISFEQAEAYAAWLRELTGRPFRLPTRKEAKALAKEAGKGGNTLDHWVGYSPNPDDAKRIHEALAKLPPGGLLQPVGSHPGTGEDPLFDLDGNAAEWAADGEKGVAVGPSADRPRDRRGSGATEAPAYIGLRVVEDLESS